MMTEKQHFIPRFYLRYFANAQEKMVFTKIPFDKMKEFFSAM